MSQHKTIATHSGSFHADDVFGVGVLMGVFPEHSLVRTRQEALIAKADFAVDVGGVWDADLGRFDHHQRGFHGARPAIAPSDTDGKAQQSIGYASAGLVWARFGGAYVESVAHGGGYALDAQAVRDIANTIDDELVQYIDMVDTGQGQVAPGLFGLSALLAQVNTNWMEEDGLSATDKAQLQETRFKEAVALTRNLLDRAIVKQISKIRSRDIVRQAPRLLGGKVLHLEAGGMPWTSVVVDEMPDVLLVIYPDSDGDQYQIKTVPVENGSFVSRLDLPNTWAGLRDSELAAVTGVPDSVFCHTNLFIGGARSLAGAIRMAELALRAS